MDWSDILGQDIEYEKIQIISYESDSHTEYTTFCYPPLNALFSFIFLLVFTRYFLKGLFSLIHIFK